MSKIRSLDDPLKKKKLLLVKLSFLIIIGLLVSAMQLFLSYRPISPPPLSKTKPVAQNKPSVLGARTQKDLIIALNAELETMKKQLAILTNNVGGEALQLGEGASIQGIKLFSKTAGDVKKKAIDTATNTVIEPIITQIQNLPEVQQIQIKNAICK